MHEILISLFWIPPLYIFRYFDIVFMNHIFIVCKYFRLVSLHSSLRPFNWSQLSMTIFQNNVIRTKILDYCLNVSGRLLGWLTFFLQTFILMLPTNVLPVTISFFYLYCWKSSSAIFSRPGWCKTVNSDVFANISPNLLWRVFLVFPMWLFFPRGVKG